MYPFKKGKVITKPIYKLKIGTQVIDPYIKGHICKVVSVLDYSVLLESMTHRGQLYAETEEFGLNYLNKKDYCIRDIMDLKTVVIQYEADHFIVKQTPLHSAQWDFTYECDEVDTGAEVWFETIIRNNKLVAEIVA